MYFIIRISIYTLITITAFGVLFYFFLSIKKAPSILRRNFSKKNRRRTDKYKLTNNQLKVLKSATQLRKKNKIKEASKLLESIGLLRESINILEEEGFIEDAANSLLRIQRPNRAAVLYTRHGRWISAAKCFELASMKEEAAKCFREGENYKKAGLLFLELNNYEEAARCFFKIKNYRSAAKFFAKAQNVDKAVAMYKAYLDTNPDLDNIELRSYEVNVLVEYLSSGIIEPKFVGLLEQYDKLSEVIFNLIDNEYVDEAAEICSVSSNNIEIELLSKIDYSNKNIKLFAEMLMLAKKYYEAGVIYEKIKKYNDAANAFKKAGEYSRAKLCYEKSGDHQKANELDSLKNIKYLNVKEGASFSLDMVPDTAQQKNQFSDDNPINNDTIILDSVPASWRDNKIPPPPSGGNEIKDIFNKVLFLSELSDKEKSLFWEAGEIKTYSKNEVILDLNQTPLGIYFVLKGMIGCFFGDQNESNYIRSIKPLESFAEFWVMADKVPNVRFISEEDVTLHVIKKEVFKDILNKNGAIAKTLYTRLSKSLLDKLVSTQNNRKIS